MSVTVSPTGDLSPEIVARFRSDQTDLAWLRNRDGLPELLGCDLCREGIVQRIGVEFDPDLGTTYEPVNGSYVQVERRRIQLRYGSESEREVTVHIWLCPACAVAEERAES